MNIKVMEAEDQQWLKVFHIDKNTDRILAKVVGNRNKHNAKIYPTAWIFKSILKFLTLSFNN